MRYAPVICIPSPYVGPGDRDTAGLLRRVITSDECRRYSMTGYSHINSNELVVVSFLFNYFTGMTVSSSIKIK